MTSRRMKAGLLPAFLLAGGVAQAATLIHAGRVIDGVSDRVAINQTVGDWAGNRDRLRRRLMPTSGRRSKTDSGPLPPAIASSTSGTARCCRACSTCTCT